MVINYYLPCKMINYITPFNIKPLLKVIINYHINTVI